MLSIKSGGGGQKINGIIEEFTVKNGETISTGDFVSYVNSGYTDNITASGSSETTTTHFGVALDDKRVLLLYRYGSSYMLYGRVATIEQNTITLGENTLIDSTYYDGGRISAVLMRENTVVIFFPDEYSSSYLNCLAAWVCTINEDEITVQEYTRLSTVQYTGNYTQSFKLDDKRIFVVHGRTSLNYLSATVITFEDDYSMTAGETVEVNTYQEAAYYAGVTMLDSERALIVTSANETDCIAYVCTISDTTITVGAETILTKYDDMTAGKTSAVALDSNTALILFPYVQSASVSYLAAVACFITGDTITFGEKILLREAGASIYAHDCLKVDDDTAVVFHNDYASGGYYLSKSFVHVDKDTLSCELASTECAAESLGNIVSSNSRIQGLYIDGGRYFILNNHGTDEGSDDYLNVMLQNMPLAFAYDAESNVGIAKTGGEGGEYIKVFLPNV